MASLTWSTSHAVWIDEIDDQHKEILQALARFRDALAESPQATSQALEALTAFIAGHFAHEERLMRASRYSSLGWHKRLHDAAARRVRRLAAAVAGGDPSAGPEIIEYVSGWLRDHTALADRMMAAHLRNQSRFLGKMTFRAGTKAAGSCAWVDSSGRSFDPNQ